LGVGLGLLKLLKRIMSFSGKKPQRKKHISVTEEITFNKLGGVPKGHPFTDRESPGAFKEVEEETTSTNKKI
tara:strand:- start:116 stop:331 length:216 start_codon:yes stop_codon:yes gene_type:complete